MNSKQLAELLAQEESNFLDFKASLDLDTNSGKAKFVRTVLSFANSPIPRGYILVGVADKTKTIVGVENLKEETIQQTLVDWCRPPIRVRYEVLEYQGKNLGVLQIYPARPPYTLKKPTAYDEPTEDPKKRKETKLRTNQVFVRRGSVVMEAEVDEIIEMAQRETVDMSEAVARLDQLSDGVKDIAYSLDNLNFDPPRPEFSRTIETIFVGLCAGVALAWVQAAPPFALLLPWLFSFSAIVITAALRLTHFGIGRAVITSVVLGACLSGLNTFALMASPPFANQFVFGLFAGIVSGGVSSVIVEWLRGWVRN